MSPPWLWRSDRRADPAAARLWRARARQPRVAPQFGRATVWRATDRHEAGDAGAVAWPAARHVAGLACGRGARCEKAARHSAVRYSSSGSSSGVSSIRSTAVAHRSWRDMSASMARRFRLLCAAGDR